MQQCLGANTEAGVDLAQSGDEVSEKTRGIAVLFVEGQPCDGVRYIVHPLRHEHGGFAVLLIYTARKL